MSRLRRILQEQFAARPGEGAALCVCHRGRVVLELQAGDAVPGRSWSADTLVPIFSATKPAGAACLLQALAEQGGGADTYVGDFWPAFPAAHCTVGQLLSHQAGLAAWECAASVFDLTACRAAVERTLPLWAPPQHGYHPHTMGPMVDVLMLALTGMRTADFWEQRVRCPLNLDFYLGLPSAMFNRVAILRAPHLCGPMPRSHFYRAYFDTRSITYRAFHSVRGLDSVRAMNTPAAWQCGCPARGGVSSARGLSLFYQALLGEMPGSPFNSQVRFWLQDCVTRGQDLILMQPTAFTCGAMCEQPELFGRCGFGHAGAGGCHAFAEPGSGLSFACVLNGMQIGVLPGERMCALVSAFYDEFAA